MEALAIMATKAHEDDMYTWKIADYNIQYYNRLEVTLMVSFYAGVGENQSKLEIDN